MPLPDPPSILCLSGLIRCADPPPKTALFVSPFASTCHLLTPLTISDPSISCNSFTLPEKMTGYLPLGVTLFSIALNLTTLPLLFRAYKTRSSQQKSTASPCVGRENRAEDVRDMGEAAATFPYLAQKLPKDAVVNLDHGDPTMYEAYWMQVGERGTLVIPSWQTMSYFSDPSSICWFLEPSFEEEVRRLHGLVGNAKADGKHIVVGTGSSQLFQAALYALCPADAHRPADVVCAAPYYSSYPAVTSLVQSRLYQWAGDACTYKGDAPCIEVVCSPNNPDGYKKHAIVREVDVNAIHDMAYYWPQYTAITEMEDQDIMLFTVSKCTGHAGARIGWALVKDKEVAKKMTKFIEINTIGVSKDSQLRAAKLLSVVSDGLEKPSTEQGCEEFFQYARLAMSERWRRLREAVSETGTFSLPDFPTEQCNFSKQLTESHPAFAWIKCEKEDVDDCYSLLKSHKILTRSGLHFGSSPKYARISMLDRDPAFNLFIERISAIE